MTKKITSLILAFAMLIACSSGAINSFAADNIVCNDEDERITIDGVTYKYEYSYSGEKEFTHIINLNDNTEYVVYYDRGKGIVFLNNEPLAYIDVTYSSDTQVPSRGNISLASNYWVYHDTSTHRITLVESRVAKYGIIAVATAIAAVIPGCTATKVIIAVGVAALSDIAEECKGGTVKCVAYTHVLNDGSVQFRFDWTFTTEKGKSYGPYSTYN